MRLLYGAVPWPPRSDVTLSDHDCRKTSHWTFKVNNFPHNPTTSLLTTSSNALSTPSLPVPFLFRISPFTPPLPVLFPLRIPPFTFTPSLPSFSTTSFSIRHLPSILPPLLLFSLLFRHFPYILPLPFPQRHRFPHFPAVAEAEEAKRGQMRTKYLLKIWFIK